MTPILQKLVAQIQFLPGIGEKTAIRFIHYIFSRHTHAAKDFALTLLEAIEVCGHCERCQTLSETPYCNICSDSRRDPSLICIVEHPSNITQIESTQSYNGLYFVLHGALSPIEGIGPKDLGIHKLHELIKKHHIDEIIIATSSKVEGEATAYYLYEQFQDIAKVTRLAAGIPMGGTLDYIDGQTLRRAFSSRHLLTEDS